MSHPTPSGQPRSADPATAGRRHLLRGGAIGLAAAAALPGAAQAQPAAPPGFNGLVFLNQAEARTVEAIAERIWPATETGPGARQAGALHYIDRALDGAYARHQHTYRVGLRRLDAAARAAHDAFFAELTPAHQDALIARLERNEIAGFPPNAGTAFFELLRTHTMEGVLSDPVHGGNRDFAGWRTVGYPGPYYFITEDQQQRTNAPVDLPTQSVADL